MVITSSFGREFDRSHTVLRDIHPGPDAKVAADHGHEAALSTTDMPLAITA
jgi:hypothetical protein